MKVARFGDNMREVAVTEGNKVSAQIKFGYSVHAYGVGELVEVIDAVSPAEVNQLVEAYHHDYDLSCLDSSDATKKSLSDAAKIEAGMRNFLKAGGFSAYTNTFEDLYGMTQLPGIPTQRLMQEGYGFGAEGDWKTSALLRTMKFMAKGLEGGTSFMEDYTYHLEKGHELVLGSHMLEVCPSIACPSKKPSLQVHHLGIGGKEDPARLVFDAPAAESINATMLDMGNRFRLLVNEVETVKPKHDMPKLPVARALWRAKPDLKRAAAAWILAGGAHHTSYSQALNTAHMQDFADIADVEMLVIDDKTEIRDFKNEMRWNDVSYKLNSL
jgi:L-arabinose isomerase